MALVVGLLLPIAVLLAIAMLLRRRVRGVAAIMILIRRLVPGLRWGYLVMLGGVRRVCLWWSICATLYALSLASLRA